MCERAASSGRRAGKPCSLPAARCSLLAAPYHSPMNWIIKNFLRGLVIVVPIAITVYVVVEAFLRIDRLLELRTPGLGFAVTIGLIVAVGVLATNIVGRTLLRLTETIFTRAPIVRIVYAAVKDLL